MPTDGEPRDVSEKAYLTPADVAVLLGLSERTIKRYISDGTIPAKKLGGRWIIRRVDLDRVLAPDPKPERRRRPTPGKS